MHVIKIDNTTFTSKNFRLPINDIVYTVEGRTIWSKKANSVREYSNPNAKELYQKAQKTNDIKEMAKLYSAMGHYEIKKMNFVERVKSFFNL